MKSEIERRRVELLRLYEASDLTLGAIADRIGADWHGERVRRTLHGLTTNPSIQRDRLASIGRVLDPDVGRVGDGPVPYGSDVADADSPVTAAVVAALRTGHTEAVAKMLERFAGLTRTERLGVLKFLGLIEETKGGS